MTGHTKAKLFIVSAPSGSGKTTLCRKLLGSGLGLVDSVSMTTRLPRPGERNGDDYIFVTDAHFRREIRGGGFLEYEENFGHLYGTPKAFVEHNIRKGRSVLLNIDVKGAMKVARAYPAASILIFILPPSIRELKKRLHLRKSDSDQVIAKRLAIAKKEISYKEKYDYRIVNDHIPQAYKKLKAIIEKEIRKGVGPS
ncbi:MAG: guanylate kinase [Candidatus Omnitrophica bacterium]|nr:guanylate kinase [Candidatus Omnitrophota bacterium]